MVLLRLAAFLATSPFFFCLAGRQQVQQILHESAAEPLDAPKREDDSLESFGSNFSARVNGWPVAQLNEQIFRGNVLREDDDRVLHWIVYWCPDWWQPCQDLMQDYTAFAQEWHEELSDGALMTLPVRFARVNCATDKVLCNAMGVDDYPTVQHYTDGKFKTSWVGRGDDAPKSLHKWLYKELRKVPSAAASEDLLTEVLGFLQESASQYLVPGDHAFDVLLILLLLFVNFWAVSHSPSIWQKDPAARGLTSVMMRPVAAADLLAAAHADVLEAPACERSPSEEEPSRCRLERMLPDEWLLDRGAN